MQQVQIASAMGQQSKRLLLACRKQAHSMKPANLRRKWSTICRARPNKNTAAFRNQPPYFIA
jgi:hypothetical protein